MLHPTYECYMRTKCKEPPNMWKSVQRCEQRTLEQRYRDVTIMIIMIIMIRQAE